MVIRDTEDQIVKGPKSQATSDSDGGTRYLLAAPLDRLAAFVIDHMIILSPVILMFCAPFERQLKEAMIVGDDIEAMTAGIMLFLMAFSILFIYHAVFTHMVGATIGQLIMGLRALRVWDQKNLGLWNASLRSLVWFANLMFLGIPTLAVFSDSNRRTWYDRLSDSVVVTIRPRRSLSGPPLYHRSMVQGFFAAIFLFALFVVGNTVILNLRDYSYTSRIVELLEDENIYCRIVGDAQVEWPDEKGEIPSRVSVALGLYFAGDLGLGCLEAEFDSRGFASQQDAHARLAKALIYSEHPELSDLYLNSVCDVDRTTAACKVARSMLSFGEGDLHAHRGILLEVKEDDPVFAKLWAIDELLDLQDFQPAAELLSSIPKVEFLAESLVPAETKVMWGLQSSQSARGAAKVAFELLPEDKNTKLASWLCYEELNQSCEAWDSVSCLEFEEKIKEDSDRLMSSLASVAYLTKKECEDPSGVNYIGLLASKVTPDTKRLVRAKLTEKSGPFRNLAFDRSVDPRLRASAMVGLLEHSRSREDFLRAQVHWMQQSRGPSFDKVGRKLMTFYMQNRDYEQAVAIAEKLHSAKLKLPRKSLEDYVVAEYYLGRHLKAKEILSQYKEKFPRSWVEVVEESGRNPASLNEFKMVVRSLR